jgi:DNA-binding response OmpR family regulator
LYQVGFPQRQLSRMGTMNMTVKESPSGAADELRSAPSKNGTSATPAARRRLLVVDDDSELRQLLSAYLSRHGYDVLLLPNTEQLDAYLDRYNPHLVILDLMMPGEDGLAACRRLRGKGDTTPIVMLTARDETVDRIVGLEMGADDYLGKPFAFEELVARVRALARRATPPAPPVLTGPEGIVLDPARRTASRRGVSLELTRKEFGVLEQLLRADGAVVSSEELLERVWDEHADPFTTIVRVTVMTLRKKLGEPQVVQTVVGAGYRL